jgi:hypothetical protein
VETKQEVSCKSAFEQAVDKCGVLVWLLRKHGQERGGGRGGGEGGGGVRTWTLVQEKRRVVFLLRAVASFLSMRLCQ